MSQTRIDHLITFYEHISTLRNRLNGSCKLFSCNGRMKWPKRGVYFFFENHELQSETGEGLRVVRVGTHALKLNSKSSIWGRLSQHRGTVRSGGGNHRGSIFRLIVGTAIQEQNNCNVSSWGEGNSAPREVTELELPMEKLVSKIIGEMPFLCLEIDDEPSPSSLRGYIERNSIALLSNYEKMSIDEPSANWLGRSCNRPRVQASGLWNSNHVNEAYDPAFLNTFKDLIDKARPIL